jgi:hypothetical protein
MAAKRKKTKRAGDGGAVPRKDEQAGSVPPANGPVHGGRGGVGRGQATPQARRYAFRRS